MSDEKMPVPQEVVAKVIEVTIGGGLDGNLTVMAERVVINIEGDVTGNIKIRQMDPENFRLMINGTDYDEDEDDEDEDDDDDTGSFSSR